MTALLNRKELFDYLSKNVVDLYFTKADGTKRRMQSTLMSSVTGVDPTPPTIEEASDGTGVFTVYDMELQDWRSFRIDRISTVIVPSLGYTQTDGSDNLT